MWDTFLGGAIGMGLNAFNNWMGQEAAREARAENYKYNEMAAENAYNRQRQLYNDFYSPEALMRQYKSAGLSPSLMFGGTPGQGGSTAVQGAGTAGPVAQVMPYDFLSSAQAAQMIAQTEKTKAETENVKKDTILKRIEAGIQSMKEQEYRPIFEIITSEWEIPGTDKKTSLYEIAKDCYTYDQFLEQVRKGAEQEPILESALGTEQGQRQLRSIYIAGSRFERDIAVLSSEETNATFQEQVMQAMQSQGFANLNAKAAIKYLETNIETAELNKTQKEAWNNLLGKLGKGTTRDIIIVLGLMLNNAMMNYKLPGIHTTNINNTTNNFE